MYSRIVSLVLFSFLSLSVFAQKTVVRGVVIDGKTAEKLAFTSVVFTGSTIGTSTDLEGNFAVETSDKKLTSITVSYLGYTTQKVVIQPGSDQTITVALQTDAVTLVTAEVIGSRKTKKDTAAIELFHRVVAAKPKNDTEKYLDYYSFENYTKTEFDLYNVNVEKMKNKKVLKPFDFVLENADTTAEGIVYLPALLRETMADVYYRRDPKDTKIRVKAEQFSGVKNVSIGDIVDYTFDDINVYDNLITISGKGFVGPFADVGLLSYKYFLTDSMVIDGEKCYKLEFTGRRKQDLAFTGQAWIENSSAAIKSIELTILDRVNLNFINDFAMKQSFTSIDGYWFKTKEQMFVALNVTKSKNQGSFRIIKTSTRNDVSINKPIDAKEFAGEKNEKTEDAGRKDKKYWETNRHERLNDTESKIYTTIDSLQHNRTYKTYAWFTYLGTTAYFKAGPFEFGRFYKFFSWNNIEGKRYRFGGRTSPATFSRKVQLGGYLAWGDKDREFKYYGFYRMHLKRINQRWHQLAAEYQYDLSQLAQPDVMLTHDNILVSLMRPPGSLLSRLMKERSAKIIYEREWRRGVTQTLTLVNRQFYTIPTVFDFQKTTYDGTDTIVTPVNKFVSSEVRLRTRINPKQKFAETNFDRYPVTFNTPTFTVDLAVGVKGILGSQYNFQKIDVTMNHRWINAAGNTNYTFFAGKTFGKAPYPLLEVHRGNEGFSYNKFSFNMMNEFEFVSNEYAGAWIEHHFGGLLLNQIPLIKKLKWREVASFRGVVGRLSYSEKDLLLDLPQGMKSLDGLYSEVGIGVENIFKAFRVDFLWRLTQRDQPTTSKFGFRFALQPSF